MSDDGIRFDPRASGDDTVSRPLAVARTAVSEATEQLRKVADRLAAAEYKGRVLGSDPRRGRARRAARPRPRGFGTPRGRGDMMRQLSMHARQLGRLIAEYLELDRVIDGTRKPNRRRTDVEALVRRVEESPDLANIDVRLDLARTTAAVDPAPAEQMIEALAANAGRRTAPGGAITVRVSRDAAGTTIADEDAGERVPPSLGEALLDPGQLLRTGAPKGGTGLILMSRLAQIHRGRAAVEDLPAGGAAFRIFLPNVSEAADEAGADRPTLEDGAIAI
jgi:signal transduction histidine kinase